MRKYKTWVGELVPSPDDTGIDGSTVDVYLASEVDARNATLDLVREAQAARLAEAERLLRMWIDWDEQLDLAEWPEAQTQEWLKCE